MSPASHMVSRLRRLQGIVWGRMHFRNEGLALAPAGHAGSAGRNGSAAGRMVEQLEPRSLSEYRRSSANHG